MSSRNALKDPNGDHVAYEAGELRCLSLMSSALNEEAAKATQVLSPLPPRGEEDIASFRPKARHSLVLIDDLFSIIDHLHTLYIQHKTELEAVRQARREQADHDAHVIEEWSKAYDSLLVENNKLRRRETTLKVNAL